MTRWGFPPPPNFGTARVTNVRNLNRQREHRRRVFVKLSDEAPARTRVSEGSENEG
jgi:hypothetical protein